MNGLEGELDEMGVKYSEALLEHEATRRVLTQASEELEKESLVRLAAERELCSVKEELQQCLEEKVTADTHLKDLVRKYTNLEDALGECVWVFVCAWVRYVCVTDMKMWNMY